MAQLTITVPDDQVPRVMSALGVTTAEEARQVIVTYLKDRVRNYELTAGLNEIEDRYQAERNSYVQPEDVGVS